MGMAFPVDWREGTRTSRHSIRVNSGSTPAPPRLLPQLPEEEGIWFHRPQGFALPLVAFPAVGESGWEFTALAEDRPTVPEFLGAGWHLPLERIVADFRKGPGQATLLLQGQAHPLSMEGWSDNGEMLFPDRGDLQIRFHPQQDRWTVRHGDGSTRIYAATPKGSPRCWFLSELRRDEFVLLRFLYHHGRIPRLVEIRDHSGYCARFGHGALRGNRSRLLLRGISLDGPQRTTHGRLQLSYALHELQGRQDPVLKSMLIREEANPSRHCRIHLDYFPPRRKRSRLLKSISANSRAATLFVPGWPESAPLRHAPAVTSATPGSKRFWHREDLTLIAEVGPGGDDVQTTVSIYQRPEGPAVSRTTLRPMRAHLERAQCLLHGHHVVMAVPDRDRHGTLEILLLQLDASGRHWLTHRRTLEAARIDFLPDTVPEIGLRIWRSDDPHTAYEYHWFDQPREWSLTGIQPAEPEPGNRSPCSSREVEPDQESLFGRYALPSTQTTVDRGSIQEEDRIHWRPDELFSFAGDEPGDLALSS